MYNKTIMMGRLTADPELRQTQSGITMCKFSIAVDRPVRQGEEKKADFFDCVAWKNTAEFISRYFSKGKLIHIDGRLQKDSWTDQNGQKRYNVVVVAENVTFCGDKSNQQNGYQNQQQNPYQNQYQPNNYQQPQQYQPQQYQQPMYASPAPPPAIGDMSDFETILSDGDTPF